MKTPKERYEEIGFRIKQAREAAKLTQSDLAEKLGFESSTAISLLEGGKRAIAVYTLERIAEVLKITPQYLLGIEEKVQPLKYVLRSDGMSDKQAAAVAAFADYMKEKHGGDNQ